jgi:hypothetical protein
VIGKSQQLSTPVINTESGIYTSDTSITITHPEPGVTIFYTLNGSEPTPLSQTYTGPILMQSRIGELNNYAMVPTNPSFGYPIGDYTLSRANNRGWLAPLGEVFKVNVIRIKAFKAGFVPSETLTKTIIVDPSGTSMYSMPVVSFVMDSIDIFSDATGIYHYGNHPDGNYTQKGSLWERTAYFEYFDQTGIPVVQHNVRTRIHGGGSRHAPKKTFRIYAEHDGNSNFNYSFFDNHQVDKFKRILLRCGGHRPDCFPRDDLANLLAKDINTDHQHYKHVIVFINGEYWGIHSIKERVDKYFIQNEYGIDDDEITILDQEYDLQDGHAVDSIEMAHIEQFADTSNMSLDANYQYVADRIDIDNYIDYMSTEIFLSNEDWVYSNIVIWKKTGPLNPGAGAGYDGKFRWLLYDLDGAFGGSCSNAYYTVNTLNKALDSLWIYDSYTRLFRGLTTNPTFRDKFINRSCDLMNSTFRANTMNDKMDQIFNELDPEMMENVDRWRYPSEASTLADRDLETPSLVQWDTTFYYLHRFANRRQRKVREHIMDQWGYPDTCTATIDVNDQSMGSVQINTILINEQLDGIETSIYPWTGIYIDSVDCQLIAVPKPGYEFVEWLESGNTNDTVSWTPTGDSTFTAIFQASSDFLPVVINELMPSNSAYLEDNFGQNDDWLELFNPNPYAVNLSNWIIARDVFLWTIPNGTIIEPNDYLLFWCDNDLYQGANHLSFKLPNSDNTVYLFSPDSDLIDFVTYPETTTDNSFGRFPNGSATFVEFTYPTPWENNDIASTDDTPKEGVSLIAYPNPARNQMQLNKTINYRLYSLDGKLLQQDNNTKIVELSHLESGTYVLQSDQGESIKISVRK